jgi:hypothetical protein
MKTAKKVPCQAVSHQEEIAIYQLGQVPYTPGSWDKKFAMSMYGALEASRRNGEALEITERQAEQLIRMSHLYRRQIEPKKWERNGKERPALDCTRPSR